MAMSVDQKRLKATKFPPEFDTKVDINKVNIELMKKWIANKITGILGDDDDVVVETCYNLIEQSQFPNIKEVQIQLTGFLGKETQDFCKELWNLMISAQESPVGVPRELLEAKKLELQKEQLSKAAAEQRLRDSREQNDMIDSFRRNERSDRPERGRGGRFRGDDRRGGGRGRVRDFDRGIPRRHSRSPRRRSPPPRRDVYVPTSSKGYGRGGRRERSRERRRSLSNSRSASPPPRRTRRSPSSDRSRTPPRRRARRSPSTDRSRSPPPRRARRSASTRSPSPGPRRRRDKSWSPSDDGRKLRRRASQSPTPKLKDKSHSPPPRQSRSRSRSRTPPRRRRRSPSSSRSRSPVRERRRRNTSSEVDSHGSRSDLRKRKRSVSTSRSRSPARSGRGRRRVTRSPTGSSA